MTKPTPKKLAQYIYDHSYIESETTGGPDGFDSDLIYHLATMVDYVSLGISIMENPHANRMNTTGATDEEFMCEFYDSLRTLAQEDSVFKQALIDSTIFELEEIEGLPIED